MDGWSFKRGGELGLFQNAQSDGVVVVSLDKTFFSF